MLSTPTPAKAESDFHIFNECHGVRLLAFAGKRGCKIELLAVSDIKEMVEYCIEPKNLC